jgi:CSLREA domain-containing protein
VFVSVNCKVVIMKSVSTSHRLIAVLILAAAPMLAAQAANPDLVVTQFTDSFDGSCDRDCSLREAVHLANRTPGASRIILRAGTYQLTLAPQVDELGLIVDEDDNANGDLDIRGQLTLVGKGIDRTTINANRVDRVLEVRAGATVQMTDLTIRNGRHTDHAGGIDVESGGTLVLRYCAISHNVAGDAFEAAGFAGGIANYGTLTVEASRIDGNFSSHGDGGSSFSLGGGIYNVGNLTVRETRFIGNRAADRDDGGYGGAIYNGGLALILRSSFETNAVDIRGRGTAILNSEGATLRLENSTVTSGAGEDGAPLGAVENGISYDSTPAVMRLINVTIAGNLSHGIVNYGKLDILNTIIAGNANTTFDGPLQQNCLNIGPGASFSQRGLLRGTDDFTNCEADRIVPNADVFTKVLYPLALNNWVTPTFALRRRSPAVDAAVGTCPSTDQRRATRPRDGDGDGVAICDLGAYERPKP